jgi:hypothetical protein
MAISPTVYFATLGSIVEPLERTRRNKKNWCEGRQQLTTED